MLVLTRGIGEKLNLYRNGVRIGTIIVADTSPVKKVRLALDLSPDVEIWREELDPYLHSGGSNANNQSKDYH